MQSPGNELTIRQISCLINAFNSTGITEHFIRLWLQVGMYKARIINNNWSPIELPKLKALNLVFNELFDTKIANSLEKLNLFYLDQLIDSNNQCLLLWPEIKIRSGGMTKERKPKWFKGEAFKIREKKDKPIQIKHWRTIPEATKIETRIEKCSGCEHNRNTVEENCTTHIKFDKGWKVILKNAISKIESSTQMQIKLNLVSLAQDTYRRDFSENKQEFKGLRSLECSKKELILQAELNEKLKKKILAILLRNLNH
ncbi:37262_t:CDS:2 [Gigaspora margarita]|uniref:37262_t:CDS:1 n=1 Tax=Gigaspora margarita TaxID=4874 RepID=A0ABN7V3A3_GIGMA|nr:37262_t:CDS:2 [Gigaspora margarita]